MKAAPRKRRRLAVLLLIPVLALLSGCMKLHMDFDIRSEDDAEMSMEIVDQMGFLELATEGCSEFSDDVGDSSVEQFTDDEGATGCRITGNVGGAGASEDFGITKDGNELVFKLFNLDGGFVDDEELDLEDPMMEMFQPDIKISVTFPGKVTYASEGGAIDGKTVTWTGLEVFNGTIEARGEAKGGLFGGGSGKDEAKAEEPEAQDPETGDEGTTSEDGNEADTDSEAVTTEAQDPADSEKSGLPMWVVVVLGLLLLLVIFLIVMLARKGRGDKDGAGNYPPQQPPYPGQQYPQQGQYPSQQQYQQYPQQGQQYPPQQYQQHPPQAQQYPPQQQWDQTQQFPPQEQPGQWNDGSQGGA